MGKVIITMQMSVDASIGPGMGWFSSDGDHEDAIKTWTYEADAMLLGRKNYTGLAAYWPTADGAFAEHVNALPKYVVSESLPPDTPLTWNASLLGGDWAAEVQRLKETHSGNLVSYGAGAFAYSLVKHGLVDEVHFWIHPVVWDEPARPFHGLGRVRLRLKDTRVFDSGVVFHSYEPLSVDEA